MHLAIHIPLSAKEEFPVAVAMARHAPGVTEAGEGEERRLVASFADMRGSLNPVIRLLGEAINIPGVQVWVGDRPVLNLTRFWSALICYQESLEEPDPERHCLRKSAKLSGEAGCPNKGCLTHCQFICTRCIGVARHRGAAPIGAQLREIAREAEVDWCPNLRLPS